MRVTMAPDDLMREFATGEGETGEAGWAEEIAHLRDVHAPELADLLGSVAEFGIREPVRVDYVERRVLDGHHRIVVALDLGIDVPVADAWDGTWAAAG